jgi:hypothetical protein
MVFGHGWHLAEVCWSLGGLLSSSRLVVNPNRSLVSVSQAAYAALEGALHLQFITENQV